MGLRDRKNFIKGAYYHVFNRGNNKSSIFIDSMDYWVFLNRLRQALGFSLSIYGDTAADRVRVKPFPTGSFSVIAYCLMPNHFHLLIRQDEDFDIDKLVLKVCTSYVKYFNKKYHRVGHLFQDRFKAKTVSSDAYFGRVSAYIHTNPRDPFSYRFSNLAVFSQKQDDFLTNPAPLIDHFGSKSAYTSFVKRYMSSKENLKFSSKHTFD